MKSNNKKISGKVPTNKVQQKPSFKKSINKKPKGNSTGDGRRNQFTFGEEKRLEKIRLQNERKADKEAKLLIARKEKKRKLKIFAKKNTKGQPVMSGRMELLLAKIEKRVAK